MVTFRVSALTALLGSAMMGSVFVGSLHLWKLIGYRDTNRDEAGTIQRRFVSVLFACVFSAAVIAGLAQQQADSDSLLELLGLRCAEPGRAIISSLALTAVLFLGPIVQHLVDVSEDAAYLVSLPGPKWVTLRNHVLAPVAEEFVFRACLVRLWVGAGFPPGAIIVFSPFCFALAHVHHFLELIRRQDRKTALLQVIFQVFYTSLFGMYSTLLLMRTGSTAAVILAHSFCNHQGFPDLSFLENEHHPLWRHRAWLGALYVGGIIGFCWLMKPATDGFDSSFWPSDT